MSRILSLDCDPKLYIFILLMLGLPFPCRPGSLKQNQNPSNFVYAKGMDFYRQDYSSYDSSKFPVPILKPQSSKWLDEESSNETFWTFDVDVELFSFVCTAPYPIKSDSTRAPQKQKSWVVYSNFSDFTTYTFHAQSDVQFGAVYNGGNVSCASVSFPGLRTVLTNVFDVELELHRFFIVESNNNCKKEKVEISNVRFDPEFLSVVKRGGTREDEHGVRSCPVIFYYEKITRSPDFFALETQPILAETYAIHCYSTHNRRWGRVRVDHCEAREGCDRLLKNTQAEYPQHNSSKIKCWMPFSRKEGNCTDDAESVCGGGKIEKFSPFIPVCTRFSEGNLERFAGSLAMFEMSTNLQRRANIVFTLDNFSSDSKKIISLQPFPSIQLENTHLDVQCRAASAMTMQTIQFALEFHDRSDLEYLPVNQSLNYNNLFNYWYQNMGIQLTGGHLRRIYCFVPLIDADNSFKWINTSRPISVKRPLDYFSPPPSSCSSSLSFEPSNRYSHPPDIEIEMIQPHPTILLSSSQNMTEGTATYYEGTTYRTYAIVTVKCWARYPVQLVHNFHDYDMYKNCRSTCAHLGSGENLEDLRLFDDFHNTTTYSFSTGAQFNLTAMEFPGIFICQSVENPCVFQAAEVIPAVQPYGIQEAKFVLYDKDSNDDENGEKAGNFTKIDDFKTPREDFGCEAIFDYIKKPEFPHYEIRCRFTSGLQGNASLHPCKSVADCTSLYSRNEQPKSCWSFGSLKSLPLCEENCQGIQANYEPVFVTCVDEENGVESTMGNFAYFGLMPDDWLPGKLYPSLEDVKTDLKWNVSIALQMEDFPEIQYTGSSLKVSCKFSRLLLDSKVYFALEFVQRNQSLVNFYHNEMPLPRKQFKFLNGSDTKFSSRLTLWMRQNLNTETYQQPIVFDDPDLDYEALENIYCFVGRLDSFQWVNVSRPIYVSAPKPPEIQIRLVNETASGNLSEISGERPEPLFKTLENQDYSFDLHSKNRIIICDVFGYPPPAILWSSDSKIDPPTSKNVQYSSDHTRSILKFDEISPSNEGQYNCTASNDQGTRSKTVSIKVKSKISSILLWTLLPTVVALVFSVGIVVRLCYRIKQLVPPEEIDKFIKGDPDVDENEMNGPIFRIPYDREKLEIDRSRVTVGEILGSGAFGEVRLGSISKLVEDDLKGQDSEAGQGQGQIVAVKTVKKGADLKFFLAFLSEIKIMSFLEEHENVVQLIGASTANIEEGEVWALVEYCDLLDLKRYLKNRHNTFKCAFTGGSEADEENSTEDLDACNDGYGDVEDIMTKDPPNLFTADLLKFSQGVANGMAYLTQKNVIHGDLAARNILLKQLSETEVQVKISDFGLSRTLGRSNYIMTQDKYLPWYWLSIECLEYRKFSIQSDIWAFGVVLWEIFSLGAEPDYGPNIILLNYLKEGLRMSAPKYANLQIYELMKECWMERPDARPPFVSIHQSLGEILLQLELNSTREKQDAQESE